MTPHATPHATGFDAGPLRRAAGWTWPEALFWLLPVVGYFAFPEDLGLLSQIAITALFALSLDLILGYAGIVSLGHAAFFGLGAYAAGLLAKAGWGDPLLGLAAASTSTHRLRLDRLSPEAVRILSSRHGVDGNRVFGVTSGNPYFVAEVIAAGDADEVPLTIAAAVQARLSGLAAEVLEAVKSL